MDLVQSLGGSCPEESLPPQIGQREGGNPRRRCVWGGNGTSRFGCQFCHTHTHTHQRELSWHQPAGGNSGQLCECLVPTGFPSTQLRRGGGGEWQCPSLPRPMERGRAGKGRPLPGKLTRLMRRFCGLRSRWRTFRLWQKPRPFSSWYMKDWGEGGEAVCPSAGLAVACCFRGSQRSHQAPPSHLTFTISGSKSPLQLSKYFFRSCRGRQVQRRGGNHHPDPSSNGGGAIWPLPPPSISRGAEFRGGPKSEAIRTET